MKREENYKMPDDVMANTTKTAILSPAINTSGSISINFEKLSGITNYANWKFLMKMYLVHEDLWDCIESTNANTPIVTDERKQQKALAKICLMVQSSSFAHVRNAKTGQEAWLNLKRAYEDKGLCRRLGLLRTLFALKLDQFSGMEEYVTKVSDISQSLQDIDSTLEDDFVAVIMLSGLSSDYDPLIMALENSNVKLSSETVKLKLLQESTRRKSSEKFEESALIAVKQRKFRCFHCNKIGHIIKNCPLKGTKTNKCNLVAELCPDEQLTSEGTLLTALPININSDSWYIDSGATCHMTNNKNLIKNYTEDQPRHVTVANNHKMQSNGHGIVEVLIQGRLKTLTDVIFVPELSANLLSVSKMTEKGLEVYFDVNKCIVYDREVVVASATKVNGVYELDTGVVAGAVEKEALTRQPSGGGQQTAVASASDLSMTQELWHRRLGHLNKRSMTLLKQGMATGINYSDSTYNPCVACIEGKQSRLSFPRKSYTRATEKLGLIHSDICGPMPETSFSGAKYLLTFIDDYSRMTFGYFIKTKDEVFDKFTQFKNLVENQTCLKIKALRTDNGREYVNDKFQKCFSEHGIQHQTTVSYSAPQNGVAERANRTILEAARCMLQDAGLSKQFWAEAVNTAIYIKNKSPTKAVRGTTPEEKWTGNKVDISNLRVFGCIAYSMILDNSRKKLDSKSKMHVFVGYCQNTKGYRLVDIENPSKVIKARDVHFLENKRYKDQFAQENNGNVHLENSNNNITLSNEITENDSELERSPQTISDSDSISESSSHDDHPSDVNWTPNMFSSSSSDEYEDVIETAAIATAAHKPFDDEPLTAQEALSGTDSDAWHAAVTEEYESFEKNKVWTLTQLRAAKQAVKCKWFKKKYGTNGELLRYKARLVAKGFTQKYGFNYQETYSPVGLLMQIGHLTKLTEGLILAMYSKYSQRLCHNQLYHSRSKHIDIRHHFVRQVVF